MCNPICNISYKVVPNDSDRICILQLLTGGKLILAIYGVYMPYFNGSRDQLELYSETLNALQCSIDSSDPSPIMVIGDLNADLPRHIGLNRHWHKSRPFNAHSLLMYNFMVDNELYVANHSFPQQINHTYHKGRDTTYIDHVLVSTFLDINSCGIMCDIDNVSDHYPPLTDITLQCTSVEQVLHSDNGMTSPDNGMTSPDSGMTITTRVNWSDPVIKRNYSRHVDEAHMNLVSDLTDLHIQNHDDALLAVNKLCLQLTAILIEFFNKAGQSTYKHGRPTWLIDISPFSDKCDGYFQRCDWYFQILLVFSDLNHGLKACL